MLVQSGRYTAGDPQFRAAVRDAMAAVDRAAARARRGVALPVGRHLRRPPLGARELRDRGQDVRRGGPRRPGDVRGREGRRAATATIRVEQFGEASAGKALSDRFEEDFQKAESLSLPLTLLILIVAFGALVAAGIPLLLAATAVAATIGLIGPISQLVPVDEAISSVVLLIGLAVGVDYSMFYLRREREERARGLERTRRSGGRGRHLGTRGAGVGPDRR